MGSSDGHFDPTTTIQRQDASMLIAKALHSREIPTTSSLNRLSDFKDGQLVSGYAREAAAVLLQHNLLTGDEQQRLNPTGPLTRAEAAMLIYRLLK
ncbi:S-layer homology domain-containing protein [Paenibacillus sp. UNC451MF]|uniref:S-layer homology domain-containing protein n=1 Tax=Paenibacillus sp. UNC451MF TaxID=1449063 RepID=UPI00048DBA0E|nr:S-layer homology domain-containing protein [Paenibacillus sp. UNC451MF]